MFLVFKIHCWDQFFQNILIMFSIWVLCFLKLVVAFNLWICYLIIQIVNKNNLNFGISYVKSCEERKKCLWGINWSSLGYASHKSLIRVFTYLIYNSCEWDRVPKVYSLRIGLKDSLVMRFHIKLKLRDMYIYIWDVRPIHEVRESRTVSPIREWEKLSCKAHGLWRS